MTDNTSNAAGIAAVRRFNRFYTRQIGVLRQGLLDSPFSLAEARVLYEIAHRQQPTATELAQDLQLDAGYLSRILRAFEKGGLLRKQASPTDARQSLLSLTAAGRKAQLALEAGSNAEVGAMLAALPADSRSRILQAMQTIERLLGAPQAAHEPYLLRTHRPGDMGWIVHRHGALYAQEYGWDETFEALVAEIVAKFVQNFDPRRERCWIAERDGEILGSVFLVKHSASTAQLRLLLVEPSARGLGIGRRLVEECIRFARQSGYSDITLWTNDILSAARHIYESAGFRLVGEKPHRSFGHDLVGQTWELRL
ncbi:bifunctional helix-turn-helix transcriptional regulator/GNAT family N-acetyltransferase [Nevskia soli]|uniref:bifunctional helix-turn-helix transcriptional regulator/GNAT family N-acetyltransferase n=1 Tax=Nevskia soli TaxID=418856 RepID=UPI0004A6C55C|nr:bifunctional helix-turn-helix transcriptional regulator/GNAT family N-acetyltransferase [Nevskia soli]